MKKKKEYKAPTLYNVDASKKSLGDCVTGPTNSGGETCIFTGPSAFEACSDTGSAANGDCFQTGPSASVTCSDVGGSVQ